MRSMRARAEEGQHFTTRRRVSIKSAFAIARILTSSFSSILLGTHSGTRILHSGVDYHSVVRVINKLLNICGLQSNWNLIMPAK